MKYHYFSRFVALSLVSLLPVSVYSAETGHTKSVPEASDVSAEDLAAASERIRQTGAKLREDLKEARARLEAQKAQQEAERKREAERAHQQALKDAAEQVAIKESKQKQIQEAAQVQARQEASLRAEQTARARQAALAAQRAKEERAAKEKAFNALMQARKSAGAKAFEEE